ncbi:sigma factor [Pseudonocardia benzenivorans]
MLRDREEARDAVQESLLTAFRRLDGFRGEAALSTWLHRILVNVCLDRLRRAQRRRTVPCPSTTSPTDAPIPAAPSPPAST